MFKWPGEPTPRASEHEMADFVELQAWKHSSMSMMHLIRFLDQNADPDYSAGVPIEDDEEEWTEKAYTEIERRKEGCGGDGYPFKMKEDGHQLEVLQEVKDHRHIVYKYLLLATRLNMGNNRVHEGIDGTLLFEELAAEVSREYFGPRSESLVFGTATGGIKFQEKVDDLCALLNEGDGYKSTQYNPHQKDGKLDIVVWKPFADSLPGKFIGFGQCKTGTYSRDHTTRLMPESFCKRWLQSPLAFTPIRLFFISEALPRNDLCYMSTDTDLLFDRCRIIDFSNNLDQDLLKKITTWTKGAAKFTGLSDL